jgi:hypothetical protein
MSYAVRKETEYSDKKRKTSPNPEPTDVKNNSS